MYKIIQFLKKFIATCISIPFIFLKNNTVLFYSPLGRKGNVLYLYEFYHEMDSSKTKFIDHELHKFRDLLHVAICLSRSKYLFLTHGVGGLPFSWLLTCRVQLWHGYPIKKILLDCAQDSSPMRNKYLNYAYKYIYSIRIKVSYNYLVVSDSLLGRKTAEAFGFQNTSKVSYIGSPSLDVTNVRSTEFVPDNVFKFLFLPTWRDGSDVTVETLKELDFMLSKHAIADFTIDVKVHPFELKEILKNKFENIRLITDDVGDMLNLMNQYNCLITDYSSCCFEFSILNKPIVFYTPDLENYTKTRGFYISFSELIGLNQPIKNCSDLYECLTDVKRKPDDYIYDFIEYIGDSFDCTKRIYSRFH